MQTSIDKLIKQVVDFFHYSRIGKAYVAAQANAISQQLEADARAGDSLADPSITTAESGPLPEFFSNMSLEVRKNHQGKWVVHSRDFNVSTTPQEDPEEALTIMWRYIFRNGGVLQMIADQKKSAKDAVAH